uniref:Si:ch211-132e22.4 n=1 Tax=Amphiprion percula TaxID=161767 RepID=A0A3P8SZB6_AMPPE
MADSSTVTTTGHDLDNVTGSFTGNATATPAAVQVANVISWLTVGIGLPAIGLAIYTLKNLSKGDGKVPVHVMFLLVSDIISFFGRPQVNQEMENGSMSSNPTDFIFYFGVVSNITLMLFIAQERHLLVAYPQCLGCCSSFRRSPAVALVAWAAPFGVLALALLRYNLWFAVSLLTPFPFLLFFAVDAWRALICSRSNPPTPERRRTVLGIGAIWANYTVLYSPFVLSVLLEALNFKEEVSYLSLVSHLLLYLSPLVDPFLYIFMTKGLKEVLQALPCCQKPGQKENRRPTVDTVAETVETRL